MAEGFHPEYTEVFLQYGAERRVIFRAGTECPQELIDLADKYFNKEGVLLPGSFGKFQTFLSKASEIDHDLRCYDDVLNFVAEVRDEDKRKKHLDDVFPVGARSAHFKNLLRVPLYKYQREGALFAARAGRCLIGDEMGLGKTIQALAAAEIMAQEFGVEQVLIVCPTSLKHQWKREIEKFTRRTATVVEGLRPQRMECYHADSFYKIVNYDIVYRDLDFLAKLSPDLVILDEAQRIKNWETRTAQSVKQIDTPYAIVLTGTPLENRLEELVSIVQFVDRHRLGPTYRFLHEHQELDGETGRVIGYKNLDKVGETLKPVLIRRQKKDVLDELPQRLEKNLFVPMTEAQMHPARRAPRNRGPHRPEMAAVRFSYRSRPAAADDRAADDANELQQHVSGRSPNRPQHQARRTLGDSAGRAGVAREQGRNLQPMDPHARIDHPADERRTVGGTCFFTAACPAASGKI